MIGAAPSRLSLLVEIELQSSIPGVVDLPLSEHMSQSNSWVKALWSTYLCLVDQPDSTSPLDLVDPESTNLN